MTHAYRTPFPTAYRNKSHEMKEIVEEYRGNEEKYQMPHDAPLGPENDMVPNPHAPESIISSKKWMRRT